MIATIMTLRDEAGNPVAPRTSANAVSLANGKSVETALGGCWIEFADKDGNPTDEPYIHWYSDPQN